MQDIDADSGDNDDEDDEMVMVTARLFNRKCLSVQMMSVQFGWAQIVTPCMGKHKSHLNELKRVRRLTLWWHCPTQLFGNRFDRKYISYTYIFVQYLSKKNKN